MDVLKRISLKNFVTLTLILMGGCFTVVVASTLYLLEAKNFDGMLVDIAGRQRMLNQRFAKEMILKSLGGEQDPQKTFNLILKSGKTLLDGGLLKFGANEIDFPKATNDELRNLLSDQITRINENKKFSDEIITEDWGIEEKNQKLAEFNKNIQETHVVLNNVVKKFVAIGNESLGRLKTILITSLLFLFGIIAFTYLLVSKRILNVEEVSGSLTSESSTTSDVCHELNESTTTLSATTNELHASIHESVAAIEEMKGMLVSTNKGTKRVHKSSQDINESSTELRVILEKLTSSVLSLGSSMKKIEDEIVRTEEESKASFNNITRIVDEISKKAGVINDIVLKTQLLSFNASIEAVRAGEHGKGFALVAQEVGNLARLTGKSAEDISELLESSSREIASIEKTINEQVHSTRTKVESGSRLASESLAAGNASNEKFKNVQSLIIEISGETEKFLEASQEQMRAIEQVAISMEGIRNATDLNMKATETNVKVVEKLRNSAVSLDSASNKLNETIQGNRDGNNVIPFDRSPSNDSNNSDSDNSDSDNSSDNTGSPENKEAFEQVLSRLSGKNSDDDSNTSELKESA